MANLIEVVLIDGTTDIVSVEEAAALREENKLAPVVNDNLAMTIEDLFGEGYEADSTLS